MRDATLAGSALAWAAARDCERQFNVYRAMETFARNQAARIRALGERAAAAPDEAGLRRELRRLILETETRLLGETADWYVRRYFTSIA